MVTSWKLPVVLLITLALIVILVFLLNVFSVSKSFPLDSMYTIPNGAGLTATAKDLQEKGIINSPFLFKAMTVILGGSRGLKSGDYVLDQKQGVIGLASRFAAGDFRLSLIKVTVPEGLSIKEIGTLLSKKLIKINPESFNTTAQGKEGYLFPETYLFLPNTEAKTVVAKMQDTFEEKISTLGGDIKRFNKPLSDIIKMASIIEEEARTTESRRVVAGILWKRLSLGMPLQVDASFKYINGKGTKDLTLDDLKIDSPYNSYLYKGLPPTPICNPGLDSISATITPIMTDYIYFLTDKMGDMHYAKTYAEHLQNKNLYLK
jgi:UPF0755 protein